MEKNFRTIRIRAMSAATAFTAVGISETMIVRASDLEWTLPPNWQEQELDLRQPERLAVPYASGSATFSRFPESSGP